jgi:hypothetical protein
MCEFAYTGVPSRMSAIGTEIVGTLTAKELAHVGAPAQALIAGTALRGARHADAIADLHAAHSGPTASTTPTPP